MLPTARSFAGTDSADLHISCRDCPHRDFADLAAIVAAGKGDVPLVHLKWRCKACGSRRVDAVITGARRIPIPGVRGPG